MSERPMFGWHFHVEDLLRFGSMGYRLYVTRETAYGNFEIMTGPLTLKTYERNMAISHDDALFDDGHMPQSNIKNFLQAAVDAAWEIGIRPRQMESHTDELKAVRYHLEDMRKLVLK